MTDALLAIDTSAGTSVAVVTLDGALLAERATADTRRHAEVLGPFLAEVLHEADSARIVGVVAGMGPGPFTGLRVGIAAADAFALGRGVPLHRLVSHEGAAWAARAEQPGDRRVTIVTDARRRELYATPYRLAEGGIEQLADPALARPDELEIVGERIDAAEIPAAALGQVAADRLRRGQQFPELPALYLRAPDVTPSSAPKRVVQ